MNHQDLLFHYFSNSLSEKQEILFYNLLENALKYSPEKPEIKIELLEKDTNIVFKISDNGIGIPLEFQDKIFEKFFRVPHGNTHNFKGYGLGLSYVSSVVAKHNGFIEMKSKRGEGTVFFVTLLK